MTYKELNIEERATIQVGLLNNLSLWRIACLIGRSPSTISRESRQNQPSDGRYEAPKAKVNRLLEGLLVDPVKSLFRVRSCLN